MLEGGKADSSTVREAMSVQDSVLGGFHSCDGLVPTPVGDGVACVCLHMYLCMCASLFYSYILYIDQRSWDFFLSPFIFRVNFTLSHRSF